VVRDRFGRGASTVLVSARRTAIHCHHRAVTSAHLLLALTEGALIESAASPAMGALLTAGLTPQNVRRALVEAVGPGVTGSPDPRALRSIGIDLGAVSEAVGRPVGGRPPGRRRRGSPRFAEDAKSALWGAVKAAKMMKQRRIRPEHILIGILDTRAATAMRVLDAVGVDRLTLAVSLRARMGDDETSC
jgi:ATP-dependent Clp protease ATP-binding subunit ClpA